MSDKPILFSGPMVRAILEGRKTQTRRLVKVDEHFADETFTGELVNYYGDRRLGMRFEGTTLVQPIRYAPGDRLWVRETFSYDGLDTDRNGILPLWYWADRNPPEGDFSRPKPSIHMPRWASRLTLIVEDVRVERLQDISHEDAIAEGMLWQDPTDADRQWAKRFAEENGGDDHVDGVWIAPGTRQGWGETKAERDRPQWGPTASFAFRCLWDSLNAKRAPWVFNPWVVAVTFRAVQENIDRLEDGA